MVTYGPTIANLNEISGRCINKKDGVYQFRGLAYRVKGGRFTHFAHNGTVCERAGNFNVEIGKCTTGIGCFQEVKKILAAL
jgi:hypothetical protein